MAFFDKKQASLNNDLGWSKARMNAIWHGKQRFNRDLLFEVADWLGIEAYELLMHPKAALQLRQLREAAVAIAAGQAQESPPQSTPSAKPKPKSLGTSRATI